MSLRPYSFNIIFFCLLLISIIGCSHRVIIQDKKVVNKGLYEIKALEDHWKGWTNIAGTSKYGFSNRADILYLRCPEHQGISIFRTRYQHQSVGNSRRFFPSNEEFMRYFFEDFHKEEGVIIEEIVSSQTVQLQNRPAVEFTYIVSGRPPWCGKLADSSGQMQSKMIVLKEGQSFNPITFGQLKFITLIYTSPPETFDQAVGEFDEMVQSFRLIK